MRILLDVATDWVVRLTCAGKPPTWLPPRHLRKLPDGRNGFLPFPPADDLPGPTEPHFELCVGEKPALVYEIYDRITKRDPRAGEVEKFGRYLFTTLIGQEAWTAIRQVAAEHSAEQVELALLWGTGESDLHRLNWEMMRGPEDFLASGRPLDAAITRMVAGALQSPREIRLPPRVLFLVGTRLYDPDIRPGAEALGLLRQVKCKGRSIHSRIVQCATPAKMRAAIAAFRPDVVHLICHGDVDRRTGKGFLILRKDDDHPDEDEPRYASQLLEYLGAAGGFPPIVVLSACYSAGLTQRGLLGAHDTAPLAAELIAGGVPIVVGMAGRVADSACRLFTRRFGEALLSGESLVTATAEGRRAAFADGAPPHASVDWGFPAVFIAQGVANDYVPARVAPDDRAVQVENWIKSYDISRNPVFCGREEFLDAYQEMMEKLAQPNGRPVLAAYCNQTEAGFGRTRLLEELAAQAIRDGHVPCLVRATPSWEIPTTPARFGLELLRANARAREVFGLPVPLESVFLKVLLLDKPPPNDAQLRETFKSDPSILLNRFLAHLDKADSALDVDSASAAIRQDLGQLARDLRKKYPTDDGTTRRVFVLLDEVDRYGERLTTALLRQMLGPHGFGTAEEPVPVALAFSAAGPAQEVLRPIKESPPAWLNPLPLECFRGNGEDFMAYERVWLHPFNVQNLPKPWVINPETPAVALEEWRAEFRSQIAGLPANLSGPVFIALSRAAKLPRFLILADDEDLLAKQRQARNTQRP